MNTYTNAYSHVQNIYTWKHAYIHTYKYIHTRIHQNLESSDYILYYLSPPILRRNYFYHCHWKNGQLFTCNGGITFVSVVESIHCFHGAPGLDSWPSHDHSRHAGSPVPEDWMTFYPSWAWAMQAVNTDTYKIIKMKYLLHMIYGDYLLIRQNIVSLCLYAFSKLSKVVVFTPIIQNIRSRRLDDEVLSQINKNA